jgi:hypothetical protein
MTSPTVFFTTMVASGSSGRRSLGLNEHEFTALAKAQAQGDRREGETPEQAFTRYYEGNMDVRKAVAALRGYPIARQQERRQ